MFLTKTVDFFPSRVCVSVKQPVMGSQDVFSCESTLLMRLWDRFYK